MPNKFYWIGHCACAGGKRVCQQPAALPCCRSSQTQPPPTPINAIAGHAAMSVSLSSECETRCRQVILQLFSFAEPVCDAHGQRVLMHKSILTLTSVYWKAIDSNYLVGNAIAVCELLLSIYCSKRLAALIAIRCPAILPHTHVHVLPSASIVVPHASSSWSTNKWIHQYKANRVAHSAVRIVKIDDEGYMASEEEWRVQKSISWSI